MLGYEPDELVGVNLCQLEPRDPEERCGVWRTLRTGEAHRDEHAVFRRRDGTTLHVDCSSKPIVEDGGARGAAVSLMGERSEGGDSRWAAILESTTDFVGMADAEGRVLFVNRAGREMVGAGEDEDLSGTMIVGYHPRWAAEIVLGEGIPTALREGTWSGETALLSRGGDEIPVSQVILAHRNQDGKIEFLSTTARDITDRKRAEDDLAQSRRLFESIAEATPDLLYVSELDGGRNVYANGQADRILGYDQEQLEAFGGNLNDRLVHPEDKERVLANWAGLASLGEGEVQEHEFRARHADGRYRWLRTRNVVLSRTEDGRPLRVLGVAQDVTEQKESQERLAYHAHLLENTHDAVIATDEHFIVKAWNRGAVQMYGWTVDEALDRPVREVIDTDLTDEQRSEALGELVDSGRSRNELVTHRKDGTPVYIEGITAALRGDQGQVTGYLSINRDVGERRRAEEALEASHRRIENILESFSDAFFAVDREWRFTYINERALARMQRAKREGTGREGMRREEFLGKNLWEEFPGLSGTVFDHKYREALREQQTAEFEAHYPPANTWFEVHVYPSEEGLSVYSQDITERKRVEEALLEIREGERRRIARDLHDVVLQELAAALQAVQATQILSEEPHYELGQAADILRSTASSLRGVVHDLRLEEGQPFVNAVEALVAGLDYQLAPECRVSLEVESGFPRELPGNLGVGLLRITREALANALRHSGAHRIAVALWSGEGQVAIDVTDDGRGFDPDAVEASRFGLWAMEERARAFGAELEVRSAPGDGTRVSVKVPTES